MMNKMMTMMIMIIEGPTSLPITFKTSHFSGKNLDYFYDNLDEDDYDN